MKTQTQPTKSKKWRNIILIFSAFIILAGGLYWFNREYLFLYYVNLRYNTFKANDSVFLKNRLVENGSEKDFKNFNCSLYREIRPLNETDIDKMDITTTQKDILKKMIDRSKKPYMFESSLTISTDSLCKYKTAYIGKYVRSEIRDLYYEKSDTYFPSIFYIINPKKSILVTDDSGLYKLPAGYTYVEKAPYYISDLDADNHDSKTFRVIK